MGRTIDLAGVLEHSSYNLSRTPGEADNWAIANDWWAVGGDLRKAVGTAKVDDRNK